SSYSDTHTQQDYRHIDSKRYLLDAVESAIIEHAQKNSYWWQENRERLCFSHEGVLVYFAILSLISHPVTNIDMVGRLLCDKNLLEFELSYELGTLIKTAFIHLDGSTQDSVISVIQALWREQLAADDEVPLWVLHKRAEYISTIPCYLRSPESQAVLDAYEKTDGALYRQPHIGQWCGFVGAPFSYEEFLQVDDVGVLRLLAHYTGYNANLHDFLVGDRKIVV